MATLLFQCAFADDGEIKGEVFIVTKAAENIRLGLVEVRLIPEGVIQKHVEERKAHTAAEMPDFAGQIKRIETYLVDNKVRMEEMKSLNEQKRKLNLKTGRATSLTELKEQREMVEIFERSLATQEAAKKRLEELMRNWPTSRHFLKNVPDSKVSTRTNSDGKFTLAMPKAGRFALVAQATRKTLEGTEEYCWMVWVSLEGKDSKEIILGNHNLMSAGSKESVVSTKSD
jgi:hypothetical protein